MGNLIAIAVSLQLMFLSTGEKEKVANSFPKRANNFSSLTVVATAYSSAECRGKTRTGKTPKEGRTVAVDPRLIPLGAKIWIKGFGWRIAEDTGGAIKGCRIDIFFKEHSRAMRFGRRKLQIRFST